MYLTAIDNNGCVLVYRSGRQGFTQYVMGQLQQIAKDFYNLKLNVKVVEKASSASGSRNTVIVTYRLDFDNSEYVSGQPLNSQAASVALQMRDRQRKESHLLSRQLSPFPCSLLLELFPFGIIINHKMQIMGGGEKLCEVWKGQGSFLGDPVTRYFQLRRPKGITFNWKNVRTRPPEASSIEVHVLDAVPQQRYVRIGIQQRKCG